MMNCKNLIHPFQHDPGISQRQRIIDDLLSGKAKIDGRSLADLLHFFEALSGQIKYYHTDLSVSNWKPFFQKSTPFALAAIIKYDSQQLKDKIAHYNKLFDKQPSARGLQLLIHYGFYGLIDKINKWHKQVKGTGLPIENTLAQLIKDKLHHPVRHFIQYTNTAVKWYCIRTVEARRLYDNEVWKLETRDLFAEDANFGQNGNTKRQDLTALRDKVLQLMPPFLEVTGVISKAAELSMDQSLLPLKEELQEKHTPHLALLFAFLKLFQYLHQDLNGIARKHLDFFYKQVLQLKASPATPDKAHILFEIQKQLDMYKLKKGLEVKNGKDNNKAGVYFALDDEIVVNKARVADKRTLFLNNQTVYETTYLEGVYMAPNADKADGIDKDFKEDQPKSFATLGAKWSKYQDPEHQFIRPYPNARLGLVLASPVLLLNEGERRITISLSCELREDICEEAKVLISPATACCEEGEDKEKEGDKFIEYPDFFSDTNWLFQEVSNILNETYYYISQDLISQAQKKGAGAKLVDKLSLLLTSYKKICYCETAEMQNEEVISKAAFEAAFTVEEQKILSPIFKPRRALNVLFSGEKEWLAPKMPATITLTPAPLSGNKRFNLEIKTLFEADQPPITFYNKETLKEDLDTRLPLVKIQLDDKVRLWRDIVKPEAGGCCLDKEPEDGKIPVSLYHFFRNVVVSENGGNKTTIDVEVCGLKNFVVQNDESVQDVNSPVYPFGTRPDVIDFDVVNPEKAIKNLIGPNFYIGSKEAFCKAWQEIYININWKDKPSDFRDYYKAYTAKKISSGPDKYEYGLDEKNFQANFSVLHNRTWIPENLHGNTVVSTDEGNETVLNLTTNFNNRGLFQGRNIPSNCNPASSFDQKIHLRNNFFTGLPHRFCIDDISFTQYTVDSANGFLKVNLQNQDFLHKDYAYVLARQMMAQAALPDKQFDHAVYYDSSGNPIVVDFQELEFEIIDAKDQAGDAETEVNNLDAANIPPDIIAWSWDPTPAQGQDIRDRMRGSTPLFPFVVFPGIKNLVSSIKSKLETINNTVTDKKEFAAVIPNEPWTPIIKEISLDYTATATITDIDLIHLYPYEGTYKKEELEQTPSLLPTFCDEGTLFLGLKELVPGSNVNILFQMAEATADSESERVAVNWFYLENNQWKLLRPGFEVLDDATKGLTSTGIIKFALPANMSLENTILPKDLHWIKATIPKNSRSVSESMGIHAQAIRATFTNQAENDPLRLAKDLPAGSIAKLKEADAAVKKINQPYDSFGGRIPEEEGAFYVRVSELLRHKGRAIQKFDYERLALEAFPQLYKVKCINHSFALDANHYINDFPVAPGYVLLAVIPDLNKLKAAQSFEPRVPLSLLEEMVLYLRQRTSPFVRLRVMNPRYEKVHFCLKVRFYKGKDPHYYQQKLRQDLREFMAPWAVGVYDKFSFGQPIYRSDLIRFLESREYLDFILELIYWHEADPRPSTEEEEKKPVYPKTPRSILLAGEIDVCLPAEDCEEEPREEKIACDHKRYLLTDF